MIVTITLRNVVARPWRMLLITGGYSLGVAVMLVLLSVGEAMLTQAQDDSLVGGGDLMILPPGIDLEAIRTGGLSGMFFRLDRARFMTRHLVDGGRYPEVAAVAPLVEGRLLYLQQGDSLVPLRAVGEIPSRSSAVGAAPPVLAGSWLDTVEDSAWIAPTREQLYHELDAFHDPTGDSTWAEWHYFNVVPADDEWWYVTFMVGGLGADEGPGGRLLVTRRGPDGSHRSFDYPIDPGAVDFSTDSADLRLGPHSVTQRSGRYRIQAATADLTVDLSVVPEPNAYFPPLAIGGEDFVSGYVVPALRGRAEGTLCFAGECRRVADAPAYHDHNWGVWQDVTWEWGAAAGQRHSLLYGGVRQGESYPGNSRAPFFLALYDSLGLGQILRFEQADYRWADDSSRVEFEIVATQQDDFVRLSVDVWDVARTATGDDGRGPVFFQMRGDWRLAGRVAGLEVADTGRGFFETWLR